MAGFFYASALSNAAENASSLAAAEDARARGDTSAFERESAIVGQTQSTGEFQRSMAIGLGTAAMVSAGVALYFWLTGDPPGRYDTAARERAAGAALE